MSGLYKVHGHTQRYFYFSNDLFIFQIHKIIFCIKQIRFATTNVLKYPIYVQLKFKQKLEATLSDGFLITNLLAIVKKY